MTKKDLIEALSQFEDDAEVCFYDSEGTYYSIDKVYFDDYCDIVLESYD